MQTSRFLEPEKWQTEQEAIGRRVTPLEAALKAKAENAKMLDPLMERRANVVKSKDKIYATIHNAAIDDDEAIGLREELKELTLKQFYLTSTIEFRNSQVYNADRRVRDERKRIKDATEAYVKARTEEYDKAQRLANAKLEEAQRLREKAQTQADQLRYEAERLRSEHTSGWAKLDEGTAERLALKSLASVKPLLETADKDACQIEGIAPKYTEQNEVRQRATAKHLLFLGREAAIERADALVMRRRAGE